MADTIHSQKWEIRRAMRKARRDYAASLDPRTRALIMMRPPAQVMEWLPEGASVGLYYNTPDEVPARSYARFLFESGHTIALPAYDSRESPMTFRVWADPIGESDIEEGCFGPQPVADNGLIAPDVLFCPLVAFTERGERMGQGGGYYDRWLEAHPGTLTIGMAWDCQKVDELPLEDHDMPLRAIVTPTRLYGPF